MIRLGQIGLGFGLQVHIPSFQADKRFKLVSICSKNINKVKKVAKNLGVEHYTTNPQELLAKVDAVAIATPPRIQEVLLNEAISNKLHVFFEKPLGFIPTFITKAAKDQALMVNFEFMEIDTWKKLKEHIDKGKLGKILHIEIFWNTESYSVRNAIKSWKTNSKLSGGVLSNFGSHVFYYIEELFGEITEISARIQPDFSKGDEVTHLQMSLKEGQIVTVCISTNTYHGSGHRIEVTGEKGTALLSNPGSSTIDKFDLVIYSKSGKVIREKTKFIKHKNFDERVLAVRPMVKKFGDWIELKKIQEPNIKQALRVESLIEVAHKSAKNKVNIELNNDR